jgi:hypothetical protein
MRAYATVTMSQHACVAALSYEREAAFRNRSECHGIAGDGPKETRQ